jgi:two-component system, cell cycle sensor histidine kinase and response regulator CckA
MNSTVKAPSAIMPLQPTSINPTTILLVDDDDQLRMFCRDCLAGSGFRVLEGDSGLEALVVASNYGGAIDILLTDLEMPGISGIELSRVFRAICPTISVLYMSGSICESVRAELDSDDAFLPKPFLAGTLLKRIGAALDARDLRH